MGRFARHDPQRPGRLWNRWRFVGLAFWALLLGGVAVASWRRHGGLAGTGSGDTADRRR